MSMIQHEKLWVMLGIMMVIPIIFVLILPDPFSTIAVLGTNLVMLFYLRKSFKNMATSLFGSKLKYQCLSCQGMKFDKSGSCHRCGSRAKKTI